ncbi:hypothetical protein TNIN_222521 [Trichonephila inaurata madagascariensis]|uniref:Uncharacterized protein n=1 Tax=Trichonephila inaurata madagascariensis TaxID=2747483 RepID=A0A8X7C2M9_9ARAC|nr:hypothetical protein TNIN_222521 [Trichonephila inaurata madagascariensis]
MENHSLNPIIFKLDKVFFISLLRIKESVELLPVFSWFAKRIILEMYWLKDIGSGLCTPNEIPYATFYCYQLDRLRSTSVVKRPSVVRRQVLISFALMRYLMLL